MPSFNPFIVIQTGHDTGGFSWLAVKLRGGKRSLLVFTTREKAEEHIKVTGLTVGGWRVYQMAQVEFLERLRRRLTKGTAAVTIDFTPTKGGRTVDILRLLAKLEGSEES
jgi:hypothetical protein